MMNSLKLNAVTTLIQSLGFNREDKEELLKFLQKDLGLLPTTEAKEEKPQTTPISSPPQEYGEKQKFEMLFEDGTTSFYQRHKDSPIAIILSGRGRKFGLYCRPHNCPDGSNHYDAQKYARTLPKIPKCGNWRILCTADCHVMKDCFHALNRQLATIGGLLIIESRTYGVLASDDNMRGATGWQVWFAIDL